jgi:hypothetical protein
MVASIMAPYLEKDKSWKAFEVEKFIKLANQYVLAH